MMAKQCAKCTEAITGIDFVVCRGYCGATFHMNTCSGVTRALQSYFTTHRNNLFWMCDGCANLFENSHFRAVSRTADDNSPLCSLTTAITELRSEIKQLHSKPVSLTTPSTNTLWPTTEHRRATKRPREFETAARTSDCRVGSKKLQDSELTVPVCPDLAKEKFWLYISRIRPDVTVDAVADLVKANLQMNVNPHVVKLVPKGKEIDTLSFVSFKIGLDPTLKDKALDPSTWQEGLVFREFEDYGFQKFRIQSKTMKPSTPSQAPHATSSPSVN